MLRRFGVAASAALVAIPLLVVASGGAAQAADTFECSGTAPVFNAASDGKGRERKLNAPGTSSAAFTTAVSGAGSIWNTYPRILGGPNGRIYGINDQGAFRYRYTGNNTFETKPDGTQRTQVTNSWQRFAQPAYRDMITVDEIGDFYLVDGNGHLRWYRFDETSGAFLWNRVIDNGWNRYNLIVAAGPGVLYGRTADGGLFRSRFEPTSQRWVEQHRQVGSGVWSSFTKGIFSAGGDTLFGIKADGNLIHYRYREDSNSWALLTKDVGDGYHAFPNTWANTDTCKLTDRHVPARPVVTESYSPTVAIQRPPSGTELGPLEYVYADNIGQLRHGFQENPDTFGSIQWTAGDADQVFTGRPSLVVNPQGNVRLFAHQWNSDAWSYTRLPSPSTAFAAGLDFGGALRSRPVGVRLSDGTPAVFGLDADGGLWFRGWDGVINELLAWKRLGGGAAGELTVVAGTGGKASIFALDPDGTPIVATYAAGAISAWTELGGSGFNGTLAVVKMTGQFLRVFGRAADGHLLTQQQTPAGVFPGVWQQVGDFVSTGSPAAVLDPPTGRLVVVARGADSEIYRVFETTGGSQTWGAWLPITNGGSDPSATDPTITSYTDGSGQTYMIVYRNADNGNRVYTRGPSFARKAAGEPQFSAHGLT
jgi:hypothetical protein